MRKHLATLLVLGALCGVTDVAKGATDYGDLAQNPTKIAAAMKDLSAEGAQAFATELLKAANTLPVAEDAKNGLLAQIAYELVKGCKGNDSKNDMLVTIFSLADPKALPAISASIVAGMKDNNIPNDKLVEIAKKVIVGVETGAKDDRDALIRNTMVIAMFLQIGTGLTPEQKSSLVGCLKDEDMKTVVKKQVNVASGEINYNTLNEANGNSGVSLKPYNKAIENKSVGYDFTPTGGTLGGPVPAPPPPPPPLPPGPPLPYKGQVIVRT
jgi:hypothetical protein